MLLRRFRRRKAVSDPVTTVSRFVDAANRHDADAIAKCLHPDFESIQPIYPSRNFRGSMQVKRNWQAIFESEPGFRLSLVRSAANDNTVWVELHGAGRDVEVAGVFIMGVEDELVRWARVYSAVVEQPPPKMAAEDPVSTVIPEEPASLHEEAEALRRLIHAGRPGDEAAAAVADEPGTLGDEAFAPPADDEVAVAGETDADHLGDDDDGDTTQAMPAMEAVVAEAAAAAADSDADLPNPYADPDSFWQDGEVHDLVGSAKHRRGGRDTSSANGDDDAMVVDLNGRRADAGDDPEGDDQSHRSGRRRGGRRRR